MKDEEATSQAAQRATGGGQFPQTRWSVVRNAQAKDGTYSSKALAELCQVYWPPLYAYVRRCGQSAHDAEDLTQSFFARLLSKDHLASAGQEKGKLRSFLLVMLKRFMANEWERSQAQKRGGGLAHLSIDHEMAEKRYQNEPASHEAPDVVYDRQWALTLLDTVLKTLREEYVSSGREKTYLALKDCLSWRSGEMPYAEIAQELESTEGAVKAAVHRMRKRYRKLLEQNIADTVDGPEEVEEELKYLFKVFSS